MSIIFNFRLPLPTPRFLPPEQSGSGENTQSIILLSNVVKTRLRDLGELLTTLLGVTDRGSANRQIWSNSCGPIIQHWCWDEWKSQSQGPIKFWIECPFLSYFKRQGFCPRPPRLLVTPLFGAQKIGQLSGLWKPITMAWNLWIEKKHLFVMLWTSALW